MIKHAKQAFYNGDPLFYKLPNSQEISLINKFLKRTNGEMSYSTSLIDPSQQKARISLRVADISSVKMDSVFPEILNLK